MDQIAHTMHKNDPNAAFFRAATVKITKKSNMQRIGFGALNLGSIFRKSQFLPSACIRDYPKFRVMVKYVVHASFQAMINVSYQKIYT